MTINSKCLEMNEAELNKEKEKALKKIKTLKEQIRFYEKLIEVERMKQRNGGNGNEHREIHG